MPRGEMDDYSALAQRISVSVREVRGCFILSRDGLVLGAYPDEDESLAKAAWLRFCALGEPDKSFVEFADQVWAYVKRGPYAAFAVADAGVRPGILVDQLEQALMTADEGRARRDTLRVPDATAAPSGKPRTSLHPPTDKPQPAEVVTAAEAPPLTAAEADAKGPWKRMSPEEPPVAPADVTAETAPQAEEAAPADVPGSALGVKPKKLAGGAGAPAEGETEVDRVLLAKEFSGLLQMDSDDDEAHS
jgi:hypothetical protein